MKKLLLFLFFYVIPVDAQPVVPNFTTGTMSSTTNTTTSITETITSTDFATGYEYTITGVGVSMDSNSIAPPPTNITETIDGTVYTWTGLDLEQKPNYTIVGDTFQFTETYHGAGLQNITVIQRNIESESVITSTSVFSQ